MNSKETKKISVLSFDQNQVIDSKQCNDLKGGGCCTRNNWKRYKNNYSWWD